MRMKLLTLAAMTALTPAAAFAQAFPAAPSIGTPKPFNVPAGETYTLPNGLNVTLIPYGIVPKSIVRLSVEAGEVDGGNSPQLATLAASMLKEGAGNRTSLQLAQAAADMGGDISVGAGARSSAVGLNVLSERTGDAIALIADLAIRPTFPADAFERVKADQVRSLSVALSDAGTIASMAMDRALYPDHPYGTVPTPAKIAGYTLAQAKGFHDAHFGAGRARLYVVGQFDVAATKAAIAKAFGGWAKGTARTVAPAKAKPGPQVVLVDRPGAPQSTIVMNFPVPLKSDPDEMKLDVTNALLGGAFSSRITTNLREDKGYTYSPYSTISFLPDVASWSEQADVTTASTGASLHEIWAEIGRLNATPPADAETNGIKTYRVGLFTLRGSTISGLLGMVTDRDALGLPKDWLDRYVPGILAVTPADVSAVSAKRFTIPTQTLVVVGDLKTVLPQLQAQPELKGLRFQTVTVP